MALTPQQLAELQRLKQMYAPLVEAQRRRDQTDANAQKMGIPLTPPDKKAKGGLEKQPLVVYHATDSDFNQFDPAFNKTAKHIYTTEHKEQAMPYGKRLHTIHASPKKLLDTTIQEKTIIAKLKKAAKDAGITDAYYPFEDFYNHFMEGNVYQHSGGQKTMNALLNELFDKHDAVKIPDAIVGGGIGSSVVFKDPSLLKILKPTNPDITKADGGEVDDDYRGSHQAPGPHFGAPMHDVTRDMYPKDFYGPNGFRYYADFGEQKDREAYDKVRRVKDKPNEMVYIHRAIPTKVYNEALKKNAPLKHMIRKGDWVAIHKDYAKEHGESVLNGDYKIASMRVPAKHVWTNGDSVHEWGYHPVETKAHGGSIPSQDVMRLAIGGRSLVGSGKPFHSALDKGAALLKRKVGTGAEFMKELQGMGGIKQAEIDERKLGDLMGMPKMTHEQFMQELASRPAPAIQEKVLGEKQIDPKELAFETNQFIRSQARRYASNNADTSREYRDLASQEMRRMRGQHRSEIMEHVKQDIEREDPPEHEQYTLPGGENYREVLIKAPEVKRYWAEKYGGPRELFSDPDEASRYAGSSGQAGKVEGAPEQFGGVPYHFRGEPGILASMRLKDRLVPDLEGEHNVKIIGGGGTSNKKFKTRAEAEAFANVKHQGGYRTELTPTQTKKLLHLEELQSDWHQQGREKGYDTPEKRTEQQAKLDQILNLRQNLLMRQKELEEMAKPYTSQGKDAPADIVSEWSSVSNKLNELQTAQNRLGRTWGTDNLVPDAPFKKNWEEMALKRLLHHAAEKGYHGIVVTPGAEQADRYNLSKHINKIDYNKFDSGQNELKAWDKDGKLVLQKYGPTPDEVSDLIGKEAANKLFAVTPKDNHIGGKRYSLIGEDLQVGGEGMKGFYDKKVPNILNAIGKKYGVKTQLHAHPIETGREKMVPDNAGLGMIRSGEPDYAHAHHFPITEQMRKDILANGLPLYESGGEVDAEAVFMGKGGLAEFLEPSKVKDRLYHATSKNVKKFKTGQKDSSGHAVWLTTNPEFQPAAHNISYRDEQGRMHPISGRNAKFREGTNVMPLHVQAKNPMMLDDPTMLEWAQAAYAGGSREFPYLMPKEWADKVKEDYDSIVLADPYKRGDAHEVIMFHPNKIKSAIGNRGTYDTTKSDITKSQGGEVDAEDYFFPKSKE